MPKITEDQFSERPQPPLDDLPSVFDAKGVFQALDDLTLGRLSPTQADVYLKLAEAATASAVADAGVEAAQQYLYDCVAELQAAEQILDAFPKVSFQDIWKETKRK